MKPNTVTSYGTAVIAIATVVYAYFSIKNYIEIKSQNEFLKEKMKIDYVLERKKPTFDLLHEINMNAVLKPVDEAVGGYNRFNRKN
jgi:hypothetical protein